ncbi:MAG TPA: fibronectin type III domain-containing protein, partial [Anaeromyxobacteraceae bacterium]|nr:fibronectin type III domain-containing protein [Anaeromyxobacteraceae bacterium]
GPAEPLPGAWPARPRVKLPPPDPPEPLTAGAVSDTAAAVGWTRPLGRVRAYRYEVRRDGEVLAVTGTTELIDMTRRPATRACYTVRALDAAGRASEPAGPVCAVTPDLRPPTVPKEVVVSAEGETELAIRWSASEDDVGVAGYEVLFDGRVVAGAPGLSLLVKGLRPGTSRCFAVRAFDAAGNRSLPSEDACGMTLDTTPPTVPGDVAVRALSDRSARVSWSPSSDDGEVDRYEVFAGGESVAEVGTTSAEVGGLRPGRRACFAVRAVDRAGNRSPLSPEACLVTPDLTPPSVPEQVEAEPRSSSEIVLRWQPSKDDVGVAGYELMRGEELFALTTALEFADGSLAKGEYCYRVRARDGAGNRSAPSAPVCARTADPALPSPPVGLEARRLSARSVLLEWQPSRQAGVLYRVYRENGKSIGVTAFAQYRVLGQSAADSHCYRVSAAREDGSESAQTLPACAPAAEVASTGTRPLSSQVPGEAGWRAAP